MLPHTEETVPGYAATSGTEGLTDGKKCSVCGTVTVQQTVIPVLTVTVNAKGEYVFEAEHLDLTNLTPSSGWENKGVQIEPVNQAYPPTSGGKSVGACGGGYTTLTFTLEEKATVQLYARIAHAHGGAASKYMSLSLGDTGLSVSAVLTGADSNSQYFNWNDVQYGGSLNLEAGTYVITVTYKSNPNFDCIKINALSYGEFKCFDNCKYCGNCVNTECTEAEHATKCDCPTVNAEITLNDKVVTVEAESLDNSGVVTRQDMVNAGRLQAGQYGVETANHVTAIWGFTSGTTFTINVYANADMDVDMLIVGATDAANYDVATKFGLTVNGVDFAIRSGSLTGVQQNADVPSYHDWRIVNMGRISLKKGINEIVLTVKDGHPNLDCIKFASTTIADVTVANEGTTKITINKNFDFSRSTVHARQDVLNATKVVGKLTGDDVKTWAPADGSTFRIYVNVQEACKLQICPTSAAGATEDQLKAQTYLFDGVAMDYNGTVEVGAPGVYVYEFTCVIGANYSGVNFTVVNDSAEPEVNADVKIVSGTTQYRVEAEKLDRSNLVGDSAGVTDEGPGLAHIVGGYQSFTVSSDRDVTANLIISIAKYEGGSILTYIPEITVNGTKLALTDTTLNGATPDNPYWNLNEVNISSFELKAGELYEVKIYVKGGNLDGYILEVAE